MKNILLLSLLYMSSVTVSQNKQVDVNSLIEQNQPSKEETIEWIISKLKMYVSTPAYVTNIENDRIESNLDQILLIHDIPRINGLGEKIDDQLLIDVFSFNLMTDYSCNESGNIQLCCECVVSLDNQDKSYKRTSDCLNIYLKIDNGTYERLKKALQHLKELNNSTEKF